MTVYQEIFEVLKARKEEDGNGEEHADELFFITVDAHGDVHKHAAEDARVESA